MLNISPHRQATENLETNETIKHVRSRRVRLWLTLAVSLAGAVGGGFIAYNETMQPDPFEEVDFVNEIDELLNSPDSQQKNNIQKEKSQESDSPDDKRQPEEKQPTEKNDPPKRESQVPDVRLA